jgi:hypothetical protein
MLSIHCRQRIRMREHRAHLEPLRVIAFFGLGKTPQARRSARVPTSRQPDGLLTSARIPASSGERRRIADAPGGIRETRRWQG